MWRNRNVWIILAGEFLAGLGLWVSIIGNLEFMQAHIPSDFMKSLVLFTGLLAGVAFGPLAGKVIDANKKKPVLMYSGLGRLISVCFMFLALYYDSVWWMVVFAITLQISAAFYFPALQSLIPLAVSEKDLLSMNGIHMNANTISRIVGTALGGILLGVMSLYSLYMTSFITYLLLLASTWFLNVKEEPRKEAPGETKPKNEGFKAILPLLKERPNLVNILWLSAVPLLFIGGFNLMIINISEMLNDSQIKSWIYTVEGICIIAGGVLVKKLSSGRNLSSMLYLSAVVIAVGQLVLTFSHVYWVPIVGFALFGIGAGCFIPLVSTAFQTQIPKEYHGRFFSFRTMLDRVMFQVVLLGTGLFLDTMGLTRMVLLFGSLSLVLIAVLFMRERAGIKQGTIVAERLGES
ncbi:macrolide transporter [Paenibacillus swuensis]|uniref:Macrolide transporter n=1 Tax=Paenibacillus swuensis TaxID=1178515 RepID=A0A172TIC8_9BACL|nr:MFS transporter [Paenibacillus swuensis]ANE46617.1 macrolide transporter [Paenibacillus swuensis]